MRSKNPVRLSSAISSSLEAPSLLADAQAQKILRRWNEIVGPALAEKSWPDRFSQGTVWVAVVGSAWAQELRLMKPLILKKMADFSGRSDLFKDVRFGVRKPSDRLKPLPTKEAPPVVEERPSLSWEEDLSRLRRKLNGS